MDANIILESFYYLSKKMNAPIDKLGAIKLIFFADRYHLRKYGRLITEDTYYALEHGPVASNTLDILNIILDGKNAGVSKTYLTKESHNTFIAVDTTHELEYLSDSDIEALDFVIAKFSHYKTWELRNLTHDYPEWKRFKTTIESNVSRREKIRMDDFFQDAGIENDPYNIIDDSIVALSKELFYNAY